MIVIENSSITENQAVPFKILILNIPLALD